MKSRCTTVLMTFAVACVAAAVGATSAFAEEKSLPAFVVHNSVETFTGHSSGSPFFELANDDSWDYGRWAISGEINTAGGELSSELNTEDKEVRNVTLRFYEGGSEGACFTEKGKELVWSNLHGWLGYIGPKSKKEVGMELYSHPKNPWSSLPLGTCFSYILGSDEFKGDVLVKFTNPGEESSDHTLESGVRDHEEEEFDPFDGIKVPVRFVEEGGIREGVTIIGQVSFETPYPMYIEH